MTMAPGDSESPGASGAVRRVLSMVDSTMGSLARLLALAAAEEEVEEGIAAAEGAVTVEELHPMENEEAEKEVDAAEGEQEGKSPAVAAYTSRRMRWS